MSTFLIVLITLFAIFAIIFPPIHNFLQRKEEEKERKLKLIHDQIKQIITEQIEIINKSIEKGQSFPVAEAVNKLLRLRRQYPDYHRFIYDTAKPQILASLERTKELKLVAANKHLTLACHYLSFS